MGGQLLIIATSARPYVIAAKQAGYAVTVFDAYVDQETAEAAVLAKQVAVNAMGFVADDLLKAVFQLNTKEYIGFIYGSGFEMQPRLLARIAQYIPILGNSANTVAAVKNASNFFSSLSALNILFPAVLEFHAARDTVSARYVCKVSGGSGGQQICWFNDEVYALKYKSLENEQAYLQTYVDGLSVSVLFIVANDKVAENKHILVVGFSEQWVEGSKVFKFGGAVSHIELSALVKVNIKKIVERIAQSFDLVGLNSIDMVVKDDVVYVLEVNPRLSATFGLYAQDWTDQHNCHLIDLHVQACLNQAESQQITKAKYESQVDDKVEKSVQKGLIKPNAIAIVYAEHDCTIHHKIEWPEWVVDRPNFVQQMQEDINHFGMAFEAGMPICSVVASGENTLAAKTLAQNRVKEIKRKINLECKNN